RDVPSDHGTDAYGVSSRARVTKSHNQLFALIDLFVLGPIPIAQSSLARSARSPGCLSQLGASARDLLSQPRDNMSKQRNASRSLGVRLLPAYAATSQSRESPGCERQFCDGDHEHLRMTGLPVTRRVNEMRAGSSHANSAAYSSSRTTHFDQGNG